jgi:hypothetical protein
VVNKQGDEEMIKAYFGQFLRDGMYESLAVTIVDNLVKKQRQLQPLMAKYMDKTLLRVV